MLNQKCYERGEKTFQLFRASFQKNAAWFLCM